jgi:membrane-associated phospholipid phosphatase
MYLLSAAGDDGRIWFGAIALEVRRSDHSRAVATRALLALGIESVIVNGPLKSATKRERPDRSAAGFRHTRIPHNSSFPSGHAASSATMAVVLSDGSSLAPLWYALAAGIAWSRVHVGAHHASDVLGGLAVGAAVGWAARQVAPLPAEV